MVKIMRTPTITKAAKISQLLNKIITNGCPMPERFGMVEEMLAKQTKADAATCYLVIDDNYIDMFASYHFNQDMVQRITLKVGEGIIGKIAATKRTIATPNIWEHPNFLYRAEVNEKEFKGFLGVPIIRWGLAVGVLCLYKKDEYTFSAAEIADMEAVAMAFADWATSEEMRTYKNAFIEQRGQTVHDKFKGLSLSKGYGYGHALVHRRRQIITKIFSDDKKAEQAHLAKAHAQMVKDLDEKFDSCKLGLGEHADILDTYRLFAQDKGWYNKISGNIESGLTAEAAVERAYEDMWNRLSATQDTYLKERLHDLRDVTDRLLAYLSGDETDINPSELSDIVLVAQTMGPADLMDYDYHKIKALILEDGTATMHVAIVAKALGIPVVSKIKGVYKEIRNGELLAVNGDEGIVYVRPSSKIIESFNAKIAAHQKQIAQLAALRKLPTKTLDKQRIHLYINVGLDFDLDYIDSTNCDGIGLYRTEIPFMTADKMPDVDTQVSYYQRLREKAGDKKVVFRTLDVGSDKLLPYWTYSGEANPAIGWRSIRITLDRRAILRQQIRAFIRASAGKELNVMFPMISNLAEFRDAKETLMIELERERQRHEAAPAKVNVGLMLEVPSVIFQLDAILAEADFISVGTNDLAQFVFACDRTNNQLAERYDVLSAPFLKVMQEIITKADAAGVLCSVCGEMASNPVEAMALIGLGYRNLSCSGAAFGRVKKMIRSADTQKLADYLQTLFAFNQRTLRPQLIAYANDHGIEIF